MAKPPAGSSRFSDARLIISAVVFLILAGACGIAGAASSKATSGTLSAQLTKTRFTSSQAGSVKLIYKFSKPSKSFSYRLTFKKGSKWVLVKSAKKQGSFSGKKTTTVKKLFAGKPVKLGSYKLKLACDGGGKTLSFKVIKTAKPATKPGGGTTTTPTGTTPTGTTPTGTTPTGSAPLNTGVPAISGTAKQGETLTASNGTWNNSPTSFGYQWERCSASCSAISGATANTYVLGAADVSMKIRVSVTATNAYGSASATSSQTASVVGAPPVNTALPAISGVMTEFETLHASTGTWTNSPWNFQYQWLSCDDKGGDCNEISGANSSDYTTTVDDVFWTVRVTVTAVTSGCAGCYATATSAQSGVIQPGGPVPENVNIPVITGAAAQGVALHASTGDWTNSPSSYLYLWHACDPAITGCWVLSDDTSSNSYTPDADDIGSVIGVFVMAYNAYGFGSAYSDVTAVVAAGPPPVNTALPVISGTAKQGETLSASSGTWSNSPTSFDYQWERCDASCSAISGATANTYVLVAADAYMKIRISVTATNSYGSATATSNQTGTVAAPEVSFAPHSDFGVGSGPWSVAVGDFDGDGIKDLATASTDSDNVSVLLGTGTGSFEAATNFSVGQDPISVAVGDFDGDGSQDLATANVGSSNVSVLLGTGTGTFGPVINLSVGTSPRSIVVADFNGDGSQDLATANYTSCNVSVLLGNGDGTFTEVSGSPFVVGLYPVSIAVADFNGDSIPDLATANTESPTGTVSVLLGTGTGSFEAAANFSESSIPSSIAIGDFNGDGKQDIVTDNDTMVVVRLGDGAGSFAAAHGFDFWLFVDSIAVGDFNGDGRQDLATANGNSSIASVLPGNGDGSFTKIKSFGVGLWPYSIAIGDFNGDGKQDLVVANNGPDTVSVLLNTTGVTP